MPSHAAIKSGDDVDDVSDYDVGCGDMVCDVGCDGSFVAVCGIHLDCRHHRRVLHIAAQPMKWR